MWQALARGRPGRLMWRGETIGGVGGSIGPGALAQLLAGADPTRVPTTDVSPTLFEVMGIPPLRGRTFSSADSAGVDARTVILSEGLWRSRFGADETVLGRVVDLDGEPYEIIGVMPERFRFPERDVALWRPLAADLMNDDDRNNNMLEVVGRLAPGITVVQAQADLDRIAMNLAEAFPVSNRDTGANVYLLRDGISVQARLLLAGLGGAAICILLLACANLAGLMVARAAARERELSVRAALGAGRERLVRQMVTEGGVLAAMGGIVGLGVASAAVPLFAHLVPTSLPIAEKPALDLRALGIAAAFTLLGGLGLAVLPALRAGGSRGVLALREGSRTSGRRRTGRRLLVAVQVASSVVRAAA